MKQKVMDEQEKIDYRKTLKIGIAILMMLVFVGLIVIIATYKW